MPSDSANTPAITTRGAAAAITAGSGENRPASSSGMAWNTRPHSPMNAAPKVMARNPARRAAGVSPRPTCRPTRAVAALAMPKAIMNVSEASVSATE